MRCLGVGASVPAGPDPPPPPTTQLQPIGTPPDGQRLYVGRRDQPPPWGGDSACHQLRTVVPVGKEPSRVIVGANGRVYVSNRQDRSVSVIEPKQAAELTRIAVGTEPTGLALADEGTTLLVANTTNATVSIIDTASLS